MALDSTTVEGTLQPDGVTLQLDRKVSVPPGRVRVEVRTAAAHAGPGMLEVLDRIHQDQRRRGRVPITEEEMARQIDQLRADDDGYEARWQTIWSQTQGAPAETPDADLPR